MRWYDTQPHDREALISAALGEQPMDLVLRGVRFVNVHTGEVYPADIGIFQGRIAHIADSADGAQDRLEGREVLDRSGMWAIPGLIDTHVHIESSMVTPEHFAEAVLPAGTTTVLIDPHEFANVSGLEGVRYMVDASDDIPLRVLVMAPSCVPSALEVETAGASFDAPEIATMLDWPRVVGLAEVMDYPGVLRRSGRMMRELDTTLRRGALAQGHAPGLVGRQLSAYASAGINSDHENRTTTEALAKLRAGMYLEVRESSLSHNAAAMAEVLRGRGYLPNVTLCTDDVTPEDLLRNGHVSHVARSLIREGLDPVDVVRFATLNAANRIRRTDLGALAPGRIADLVLLSDMNTFQVEEVYRAGSLVAAGGQPVYERRPVHEPAPSLLGSVHLPAGLDADRFRLRVGAPGEPTTEARIRVIRLTPQAATRGHFEEARLEVRGGELVLPPWAEDDLAIIAVIDRHATHGGVALAVARGFGLRDGALASTVSHDCHQLTVVGRDPRHMLAAARRCDEIGGGIVLVEPGGETAEIRLPVAGLVSDRPAVEVADEIGRFRHRVTSVGLPDDNSFMLIVSLTLAVIPEAKVTDLGLLDVAAQKLVPLVLEEA